jgi:hypothetical protein
MEWSKSVLSMLSFRPGFGMDGHAPGENKTFNSYSPISGEYKYLGMTGFQMDGIRLTDLRRSKKCEWNFGTDFGFFNDLVTGDFNYYDGTTSDQIISGYKIPSSTGYQSLAYKNSGAMRNYGWELNVNGNKFIEIGKFSISAYANVSQNFNTILEMEESILNNANADFDYKNGSYLSRIQIGNPLGSIYGFKFKGVYQNNYNVSWTPNDWKNIKNNLPYNLSSKH